MGIDQGIAAGMTDVKNSTRIRKAVIPIAGAGTRMLPLTKTVPKELMPVGTKPLIQYAVEEAVGSGIEEITFVCAPGKTLAYTYFDRDVSLERYLERLGKRGEADAIRLLSSLADIRVAYQRDPLGLGQSVLCARHVVRDEPFVLILPDALITAAVPCSRQLIECYESRNGSYIATRQIDCEDVQRYGVMRLSAVDDPKFQGQLFRVHGIVEKPRLDNAPSRYGVFGRYVLQSGIFDVLEDTKPDARGEIQISDAIASYCQQFPVYAFCFQGSHYDLGSQLGLQKASTEMALQDPAIGEQYRNFLRSVALH
jgi:UTP--glucose-1-phosphate uridylyltransferase